MDTYDNKRLSLNQLFDGSLGFPVIKAGEVNITTGEIEVGDPICYMNTNCALTLEKKIPVGKYPVWLAVLEKSILGTRYLAAKLSVTEELPIRFVPAMPKGCTTEDENKPGVFAVFGVETGMACFCDKAASIAYSEFLVQWHKEHPDGNHYDDLLAGYLRSYAERFPQYQNKEGDYMEWYLPGTEHNLVMFASGYGDGAYSGYWGLDQTGEIACLILPFIDPESSDYLDET